MIVRCNAVANCMFLADSQIVQVVGLYYGEVAKNCKYFHFLTGARMPSIKLDDIF